MTSTPAERESIAWIVSSYRHDWRQRGFVERFLSEAARIGAVGRINTVEIGDERASPPVGAHQPHDTPGLLTGWLWSRLGPMQVDAGGTEPRFWSGHLSFIPDPGATIGRITLRMDGPTFRNQSDALWKAFRSVHDATNTSYACIHPWRNWISVRDREPPLINSETFQTVLWANFIGPDLMRRFDRTQLADLGASAVEWTPDGGVFLRLSEGVTDLIASASKTELERERRVLARRFKAARSY